MSEDGVVRRRRSGAEAEALVAEFEASGLMRAEFCRRCGLAVGALDKYRQRVHRGSQSAGGHLLPVEVISSPEQGASCDDALVGKNAASGNARKQRGIPIRTR
jgi:hypothetical protein